MEGFKQCMEEGKVGERLDHVLGSIHCQVNLTPKQEQDCCKRSLSSGVYIQQVYSKKCPEYKFGKTKAKMMKAGDNVMIPFHRY